MDWQAERERDQRRIDRLAERGASVGQGFKRWINQADRDCWIYAAKGTRYAYTYEMPAGGIFTRTGDTTTRTERTVSLARLPKWAAR
jgi:hypothetical protein